ncbi:hypothetical protein L484_026950 [Morus notabilis]|uniref:Bifunctional inhibitor/plant lipid transfer protein/seed storage helical domain-containing protein n=1 Tax=Morus notabilis TaxID=981085 RepID=W9R110_9ROSA|nr:putative lipid-transfer protein DIR1 [Morus notabilis]EXB63610.1 hypothetical protein L484_026950 [Morus notabilis]
MATHMSKNLVIIQAILFLSALAILSGVGANGEMTYTYSFCRMTKEGFGSCQPSVDRSNPLPPSKACCAAISKSDFQCLCYFKDSPLLKIYQVDPQLAVDLPRQCNLDGPSFRCE